MIPQRARVAATATAVLSLAIVLPGDSAAQTTPDSAAEARARQESVSRAVERQAALQEALTSAARAQQAAVRARQLEISRANAELRELDQELRALRMQLDAVVSRMASDPSNRVTLTDSLIRIARRSMLVGSRAEAMRHGLQHEARVQLYSQARKGWLGVNFEGGLVEETPAGAVLWAPDYPRVFTVVPGSPAEQAGLTRGDRIVTIAGRDVRTNAIMLDQVFRPGSTVTLRVDRDGRRQVMNVRVTERPEWVTVPGYSQPVPRPATAPAAPTRVGAVVAPAAPLPFGMGTVTDTLFAGNAVSVSERFWPATITAPELRVRAVAPASPIPSIIDLSPQSITVEGLSGVTVALRSSELAYAFGARLTTLSAMLAHELSAADGGVLVLDVAPGTPASRAGLRPLDVLVQANGQPLSNPQSLIRLVRSAEGQVLQLQIVRRGERSSARLAW